MTVCLAAIAMDNGMIVCIADKAIALEGVITWDSDSCKILQLGNKKAVALTAGNETEITKVIAAIEGFDGYAGDRGKIVSHLEEKYRACFETLQEQRLLVPIGLTREAFVKATSGKKANSVIESLAQRMAKFEFGCDLLVCGFDDNKRPYIFYITSPGVVTDYTNTGYWAVGTGTPMALARLIFNGHERKDGAAETLYDCFDAKANGEMDPNVGYAWDAALLWGGGVFPVTKHVRPLIESVWALYSRSPFKWDERKKDDLDDPPSDWVALLRECVDASLKERDPQIPAKWKSED